MIPPQEVIDLDRELVRLELDLDRAERGGLQALAQDCARDVVALLRRDCNEHAIVGYVCGMYARLPERDRRRIVEDAMRTGRARP